jgi:hypothetical protein
MHAPRNRGAQRVRKRPRPGYPYMSEHHTDLNHVDVDEAWIADWAAEGIATFEQLLAKHAAFARYLASRTVLDCVDVDGGSDV